ncbi:unnamed protein product [Vitrella brassicaformis CCMP3155]|uniref:SCP domain-containing protein n=1 Tax=Vitrella brassicaformis (strain CCMP3155) TaxID=1169540 RepID=A0A0G4EJ86_VITBC|nr:unnamed protein product [Vitrella brassicaformis CCMP3155]|eukprot:CEL96564.1 unnamed protein product [Vitrella brassicaformis CCMP3155]
MVRVLVVSVLSLLATSPPLPVACDVLRSTVADVLDLGLPLKWQDELRDTPTVSRSALKATVGGMLRAAEPDAHVSSSSQPMSYEDVLRLVDGISPPSSFIELGHRTDSLMADTDATYEDVTDDFVRLHANLTKRHGLPAFKAAKSTQDKAMRWCSIQAEVGCDLKYPAGVSFSAALVPSYFTPPQVVSLWYSQGQHYDYSTTLLQNMRRVAEGGSPEVLNFAHIAADYAPRALGCCRASCPAKHCRAYGCAYDVGAGSWKESSRGFAFASEVAASPTAIARPDGEGAETSLVSKEDEALTSTGCTANVPGNGPNVTTATGNLPYYCGSLVLPTVPAQPALPAKQPYVYLTALPFAAASCDDLTAPPTVSLPALVTCPSTCPAKATVDKHEKTQGPLTLCEQAAAALGKPTGIMRVGMGISGYEWDSTGSPTTCQPVDVSLGSCAPPNQARCAEAMFAESSPSDMMFVRTGTAFQVESPDGDLPGATLLTKNSLCTDAEVDVCLRQPGKVSGRFGVLLRYVNPLNHLYFDIDQEGAARIVKCLNGGCVVLSRVLVGPTSSRSLKFTLSIKDNCFSVLLDGAKLMGLTDVDVPAGLLGVFSPSQDTLHKITHFQLFPAPPATSEGPLFPAA